MDIQTLLVAFTKRKINDTLAALPVVTLSSMYDKLNRQISLHAMSKYKLGIPHITEMIKIKTLIHDELNRRK